MLIKVPYCGDKTIATLLAGYKSALPNIDDKNFPAAIFGEHEIPVEFPKLPVEQGLDAVQLRLRKLNMRALNAAETLVVGRELTTLMVASLGQLLSSTGIGSHVLYTFCLEAGVNFCKPDWLHRCRIPATTVPDPLLST